MSRYPNIKKAAKRIQKYGRLGDTKLVHINPAEEKLLEQMTGKKATINPKTGLKEYFDARWLLAPLAAKFAPLAISGGLGIKAAKSYFKNQADKDIITDEADIADAKLDAELKALEAEGKISAPEQQAMASLREGAEEGTMDVEGLTQQMMQPMYQQGQQQMGQALQQVTSQGLEGSIIAQEASRKVGADVRASIADQARNIVMANEKTRAGAQERLQSALFKRGDLLRNIAMEKARVEGGYDIGDLEEKLKQKQRKSGYTQDMFNIGDDWLSFIGDTATGNIAGAAAGSSPLGDDI